MGLTGLIRPVGPMNSSDATASQLREEILRLVSRYHEVAHVPKPFIPGETKIPYAGRVYDDEELRLGVESILQFWLTAGPFANQFESRCAIISAATRPIS